MELLVTGGTGYIGSHTVVELFKAGFDKIIIVDDLSNSERSVLDRIEKISGKKPVFYHCNVRDYKQIDRIFYENSIDAVIHFAGYKAVGESVEYPLMYYRNNIDSTLTLLEIMKKNCCNTFVFSSSATVYGKDNDVPYSEDMSMGEPTSPYGWSKLFIEQMLVDACKADQELSCVSLRYFNPIGAHESGLIGERPNGIPNNLMPFITQVAKGIRDKLTIFGDDYDTKDGTCERDYIHVVDLAKGHVAALKYALSNKGIEQFNIGTGKSTSVLELVRLFEKTNSIEVPFEIGDRRSGDLPVFFADVSKAKRVLNWEAERDLEDMCKDSWEWELNSQS